MRSKRTRHQPAQAKFVKRSYRGQVVLPELVMNHTESRHYYAWPVVAYLHNREPKIHMLVVPACNEFVRAEKKDWPGTDLLADDVTVSLFHVHYFQGSGNLQASETCDLVASNQHQLHPAGPLPENSEEDVNDIKVRAAHGRAIGITKISALDQVLAQCAMAGHIAFDNTHGRPPTTGFSRIPDKMHRPAESTHNRWNHMVTLDLQRHCCRDTPMRRTRKNVAIRQIGEIGTSQMLFQR